MKSRPASVVVLAGPNGAGKSTVAPALLRGKLAVSEFVNADVIARGLSAFNPDAVALTAGRIMLTRIKELADQRISFAFETTLASRSFAPWLGELIGSGYRFHLLFLWLATPKLAEARVADRVRLGGHNIPETTIRRRYGSGLRNFFCLYRSLAATWRVYDNSGAKGMRLLAAGRGPHENHIRQKAMWDEIKKEYEP